MLGPECRGKVLGLAAGEDVATEVRPAVQPAGERLHRLQAWVAANQHAH